MNKESTEKILANLAKIEKGLAKIYRHFASMESFSPPVRNFWSMLAKEEDKHAELFESLAQRQAVEDSFQLIVNTDMEQLKRFVKQVNILVQEVNSKSPSETEAYALGARIEAELNEADFLKNIESNDDQLLKTLQKIELDTKKHNMLLIGHARGHT